MRKFGTSRLFALSMFTVASFASIAPAQATVFNLDFTGVITNSRDAGGVVFGGSSVGGQNGQVISGRIVIDDSGYVDQNGLPFFGVYSPTSGLFPQPNNFFTSTYTIDGQTFSPSRWMGPVNGHSIEQASIQDIPPLNTVQQDILSYDDGSQELLCSDPLVAVTCTGGALSSDQLRLKLFGIYDFVGSDALTQLINLNAADIANIISAPSGGQTNSYTSYHSTFSPGTGFQVVYDFAGEFNLTSLSMGPASVPEPTSLELLGLSLAGLGYTRRRKRV